MGKLIPLSQFLSGLLVISGLLCFNTAEASHVKINITGPSPATVYAGTTFTITANVTTNYGGGMDYVRFYDYTGGTINTDHGAPYSSNNITAPGTPGTYTYQVKGVDNNGASKTVNVDITVVVPAAPTISGGGTGCNGSVTLTASGGNPAGGTYNWYNVASGGVALATGSTYTPTASGTYYASYTYSGYEGTISGGTSVTITAGPTLATVPTGPSSGLYLSYPFSGNTNDVSGNGNNGTIHGSVTLTTDRYGNANSAYSFDGSSGYISTATGVAAPGPQNFSIGVWFKTSTPGGMLLGYSASQTGLGSQYDRHIYMDNSGRVYFGIYTSATGTAYTINSTSTYADGNWHHAVATCSTTSGSSLYIDGALQATNAAMTTPETYGGSGYWRAGYNNLGGWTNPPSNYYFTGSLDDIAVYNSTLTASQVYSLYGAGSAPVCAGNALTLQANTVSGATYSWNGPGGFSSTSQNPTVSGSATIAMAGTYTCTVTGSTGCSSVINVTAVVNSITLPTATFTATSPVSVGSNSTITFTGTYSSTSTYNWDFNGGTVVSGSGVGPYTVQWSSAGSKTVSLTVTNSSGCYSSSTQTVVVAGSTYGNYAFQDLITLNTTSLGITSDLTNFPALLSIQDNNLIISGTCSDKVMNPTGPNYDFAFVDPANPTSELYYQVESYNQTTGTLLVWVRIPTLTYGTNNTISFYYGSQTPTVTHNAAFFENTWPGDYKAVYHFNESTYTGSVTDGTAGGHTGTTTGMTSANLVAGKIGMAYSFNGAQSIASDPVTLTGSFTISAWVKLSATGHDQKIMTNQGAAGSSTGGYKLGVFSDNTPETESPSIDRSSTPTPAAFTTGVWHYVQGVYTGSSLSTYVDGVQYKILSTTTSPSATLPLYIGVGEGGNQYYFYGTIDEVHISNVAKSGDWLKAEYADQNSPTTFTSVGATTVNVTNAAAVSGALTYTWTGSTSTNPTVSTNWNNTTAGLTNQLPAFDGSASLIIPSGLTHYPSLTADESLYGLTIASGASLNLNGHTLSVGCNIYNGSNGQILYGSNTSSGITWNGSAATQTYTGSGTSNTAELGNMTINNSSGGTVIISGGPVDIYNTLTITKGNLAIGSSPAALTLKSSATQTASVAAIPSGYSITGNVTAERFVTGGTTYAAGRWVYRNYRLMSSPVNEGADGSGHYPYSLNYLGGSTIITDCTSSFGTTAGNPSLYLYDEYYTPNNYSFTGGNFIGVTNINNTATTGHITTTDATYGSANVYAGDGFMIYFRGNNVNNLTGSPSKTTYPYVAPENVIFSTTGNLNQGTYSVVSWTGTAGLLYSTSNSGNSSVRGYNLVGNPYPSSIDWSKFSSSNSSAPIYGHNVNPTVYILDPVTSNYDTYNAATGIATGSASKIIPSGQGFFVQANGASPTLTFTENAKTSAQVSGSKLLMGTPVSQAAHGSYLRLRLFTDSVNYDGMVIGFNPASSTKYNFNEDSAFLPASGSMQWLSAVTSDNVNTSEKWLPFPKNTFDQVVKLDVTAKASGLYTLRRTDFKEIPPIYEVWLMDNYKKDSLDIRNNTTYAFDINLSDTATYGSSRFDVVIRQNPALGIHLLNFAASKAPDGSQLVWKTENEANYSDFTVERSTDDGATYTVLGGFASSDQGTYSFLDKDPLIGADQYRVKIEDMNGNISYSNTITLMYANTNKLVQKSVLIYPNPAKAIVNLTINPTFGVTSGAGTAGSTPAPDQGYTIRIVDNLGSVMQTAVTMHRTWQTNISGFMPGTYIVQVINNNDNSIVGKGVFVKL